MIREEKDYAHAQSLIDNIEALIGRDRDTTAVDFAIYQELLAEVACMTVVRMMGDTSLATVKRHYFNLDDEVMQETADGWEIPDVEVFAPDLAPLCDEVLVDRVQMQQVLDQSREECARVGQRRRRGRRLRAARRRKPAAARIVHARRRSAAGRSIGEEVGRSDE